jgi:hypothetical protein
MDTSAKFVNAAKNRLREDIRGGIEYVDELRKGWESRLERTRD